jgi:DNA-directed RNA polymerase specialized sigma24 family protein
MPPGKVGALVQHLRATLDERSTTGCTDGELLRRFAADRDEAAFAALVQRHGTMVLGVCRHVLRHEQEAEDALQATFLVLARKAAGLRRDASVAGWPAAAARRGRRRDPGRRSGRGARRRRAT